MAFTHLKTSRPDTRCRILVPVAFSPPAARTWEGFNGPTSVTELSNFLFILFFFFETTATWAGTGQRSFVWGQRTAWRQNRSEVMRLRFPLHQLAIALVVGVISGVYIFKPVFRPPTPPNSPDTSDTAPNASDTSTADTENIK